MHKNLRIRCYGICIGTLLKLNYDSPTYCPILTTMHCVDSKCTLKVTLVYRSHDRKKRGLLQMSSSIKITVLAEKIMFFCPFIYFFSDSEWRCVFWCGSSWRWRGIPSPTSPMPGTPYSSALAGSSTRWERELAWLTHLPACSYILLTIHIFHFFTVHT